MHTGIESEIMLFFFFKCGPVAEHLNSERKAGRGSGGGGVICFKTSFRHERPQSSSQRQAAFFFRGQTKRSTFQCSCGNSRCRSIAKKKGKKKPVALAAGSPARPSPFFSLTSDKQTTGRSNRCARTPFFDVPVNPPPTERTGLLILRFPSAPSARGRDGGFQSKARRSVM